jgi:hypothetical protein
MQDAPQCLVRLDDTQSRILLAWSLPSLEIASNLRSTTSTTSGSQQRLDTFPCLFGTKAVLVPFALFETGSLPLADHCFVAFGHHGSFVDAPAVHHGSLEFLEIVPQTLGCQIAAVASTTPKLWGRRSTPRGHFQTLHNRGSYCRFFVCRQCYGPVLHFGTNERSTRATHGTFLARVLGQCGKSGPERTPQSDASLVFSNPRVGRTRAISWHWKLGLSSSFGGCQSSLVDRRGRIVDGGYHESLSSSGLVWLVEKCGIANQGTWDGRQLSPAGKCQETAGPRSGLGTSLGRLKYLAYGKGRLSFRTLVGYESIGTCVFFVYPMTVDKVVLIIVCQQFLSLGSSQGNTFLHCHVENRSSRISPLGDWIGKCYTNRGLCNETNSTSHQNRICCPVVQYPKIYCTTGYVFLTASRRKRCPLMTELSSLFFLYYYYHYQTWSCHSLRVPCHHQ